MRTFILPDIHGAIMPLRDALEKLKDKEGLNLKEDKLVFLGDYVDRGSNSKLVLETIWTLSRTSNGNVMAIMGNHDRMFIEWLVNGDTLHLLNDRNLSTIKSFLPEARYQFSVTDERKIYDALYEDMSMEIRAKILRENSALIGWLRGLPYYIEDEHSVYVHGGFDYSLPSWKDTPNEEIMWKYPANIGDSPIEGGKKVIAGHIRTRELHGRDESYFTTGHIYLDGGAHETGVLNILKHEVRDNVITYLDITDIN